jgi:hypothetical protein
MTNQPTPTPEQLNFVKARHDLWAAERAFNSAALALPAIPEDFTGEAAIVEEGYSRYENLEVDGKETAEQTFHAYTGGWDSMSEIGCGEHVIINELPYAMPDELDWD